MLSEDIDFLNKVMNMKTIEELYYNYFCWLYPFTNENITGMYSYIDFKDKDVLTVTSSGDHALNAFLLGANNIDSFDMNPLAKYYSELKIAALKTLDYNDFIMFLYNKYIFRRSKTYLNADIYSEVKKELSGRYLEFWNYVLAKYDSKIIKKSNLFSEDFLSIDYLKAANQYLMIKDKYNQLRDIMKNKNINYFDYEFYQLGKFDKKYDVLVLSNVISFLLKKTKEEDFKKVKKIIDNISKEESTKVLSYLYRTYLNDGTNIGVYNKEMVKKFFPDYSIEYFNASDYIETYNPNLYDGVLINSTEIKKLTK